MLIQFDSILSLSSMNAYETAQSALQHCYQTYSTGGLTFEEYRVLEETVLSVLSRLGDLY
jgi:hypothetical protein